MDSKTCTGCGQTKPLSEFGKRQSKCKPCVAVRQAEWGRANREKIAARNRAHYQANREKIAARNAEWHRANREKVAADGRAYRQANRERIAAQKAAYYQANREKWVYNAEQQAAYRQANREKFAARQAAYCRANPDKVVATQARWHQNNPDYRAAYRRANPHIWWEDDYRRRCNKHGLDPVVVSFTREDVIAQYGDACVHCDDGAFEELDHYIPVAAHGPHELGNVRPSCAACNQHKVRTSDRVLINVYRTVRATLADRFPDEAAG